MGLTLDGSVLVLDSAVTLRIDCRKWRNYSVDAEQGGAFEVSSAEAIVEALWSIEPNLLMVHSLVSTPSGC